MGSSYVIEGVAMEGIEGILRGLCLFCSWVSDGEHVSIQNSEVAALCPDTHSDRQLTIFLNTSRTVCFLIIIQSSQTLH